MNMNAISMEKTPEVVVIGREELDQPVPRGMGDGTPPTRPAFVLYLVFSIAWPHISSQPILWYHCNGDSTYSIISILSLMKKKPKNQSNRKYPTDSGPKIFPTQIESNSPLQCIQTGKVTPCLENIVISNAPRAICRDRKHTWTLDPGDSGFHPDFPIF